LEDTDPGYGPDVNQESAHEPVAADTATGATELADLLAAADADGFEFEFDVADDPAPADHLRCPRCGAVRSASWFVRVWSRRLEGASDPADMLHVSALRCPDCGASGVLIAPFGPGASARQSAVLSSLPKAQPGGGSAAW
jgi:ribosomal protein S27AE